MFDEAVGTRSAGAQSSYAMMVPWGPSLLIPLLLVTSGQTRLLGAPEMPGSCDVVHMHPRLVNRHSTSAGRSNEEEVRLDDTARPVRHQLAQPLVRI